MNKSELHPSPTNLIIVLINGKVRGLLSGGIILVSSVNEIYIYTHTCIPCLWFYVNHTKAFCFFLSAMFLYVTFQKCRTREKAILWNSFCICLIQRRFIPPPSSLLLNFFYLFLYTFQTVCWIGFVKLHSELACSCSYLASLLRPSSLIMCFI